MTIIESAATIARPVSEIYNFLSDLNNHRELMPENVEDWTSTKDEASFSIKNMAQLKLQVSSRTPNQEIVVIPSEKAPFDVELKWVISENTDGTTTAKHIIAADLNMMMKMMASGPLQKLADQQTEALEKLFA